MKISTITMVNIKETVVLFEKTEQRVDCGSGRHAWARHDRRACRRPKAVPSGPRDSHEARGSGDYAGAPVRRKPHQSETRVSF